MKSLRPWSLWIALDGDSRVLFKKLGKGYDGKAIRGGTPGFPCLKGSEPDGKSAPTQQLDGLG